MPVLKALTLALSAALFCFQPCPAANIEDVFTDLKARENALELVRLSGFSYAFQQGMINTALPVAKAKLEALSPEERKKIPPNFDEKLKKFIKAMAQKMEKDTAEMIADLYLRYFSPKEIKQLLAIQHTPVVRKGVRLQPVIMKESEKGMKRLWKTKYEKMVNEVFNSVLSE